MSFPPRMLFALSPALLLPACASTGSFPSLAPRPAEFELAGRTPPPCIAGAATPAPPAPDSIAASDPALASRLTALLVEARRGAARFDERLPTARAAVARAGASGSDAWILAQEQISRLEAARAPTVDALSELEALVLERSRATGTSEEDRQRLAEAAAEAAGLAESQREEIDALSARLSGPTALRRGPLPVPHSDGRQAAARADLRGSDRAHISPGAPPRAARMGSACPA